ncbi:MAG: DUF1295 domain-containing protein [Halopseudomonas sp.]
MSAELLLLALYLLGYCSLHSWLASQRCKAWCGARWPEMMRYYRLLFNLSALLLLIPVALMLVNTAGPKLWSWPGAWGWLMNGLTIGSIVAFAISLRDYDLSQFSGTAQLSANQSDPEDQARFHLGWWHRWVRHPWYFFALLLLWSREMDAAQLLTTLLVSLYFVIGSRLEERKLIDQFGEAYKQYCSQVPGLIPLPWRFLTAQQASELEQQANSNPDQ